MSTSCGGSIGVPFSSNAATSSRPASASSRCVAAGVLQVHHQPRSGAAEGTHGPVAVVIQAASQPPPA